MITTVLRHLRSQAVAYAALFIALGGTGYAAINLPAHSVGARQLRRGAVGNAQLQNHSVSPIKLAHGSIAGYVRDYAQVNGQGQLVASRPGGAPDRVDDHRPLTRRAHPVRRARSRRRASRWRPCRAAPEQPTPPPRPLEESSHGGAVCVNLAPPQSTGNSILPQVNVAVICPAP